MTTMRNGLETWLKQDCSVIGEELINGLDVLDAISSLEKYIHDPDVSTKLGTTGVQGYTDMFIGNSGINNVVLNVMDEVSKANCQNLFIKLHTAIQDKNSLDFSKALVELKKVFTKQALERTVECQCGKETKPDIHEMTEAILGFMRRHPGGSVSVDTIRGYFETYTERDINRALNVLGVEGVVEQDKYGYWTARK